MDEKDKQIESQGWVIVGFIIFIFVLITIA